MRRSGKLVRQSGLRALLLRIECVEQIVAVGDRLGEVGNSGNTSEPHLHVHVQRGVGAATLLDAEPRPATFDGAWRVRNDRLCFEK